MMRAKNQPLNPVRNTNIRNIRRAQKRAHHNELERKRRKEIKFYFERLKNTVNRIDPAKELATSRRKILTKSANYIMKKEGNLHLIKNEILAIKNQNRLLEAQVKSLEMKNIALTEDERRILDELDQDSSKSSELIESDDE
ncbi:hypothetical protein KQX54_002243 [Cotesia glomerata]|uniref:BHLH domain-containing protein n=1 Tax=Cotesia glomerata TaxID=32391 RepID=A0AAV7HS80_COTGL|nr:hypothetical protein KQX54_002243 [Cotesia glomerata]